MSSILTKHARRIRKFMRRAGQDLPGLKPIVPDEDIRRLRAKLILEEALETIQALGFSAQLDHPGGEPITIQDNSVELHPVFVPDLTEIADGCADISVVTIGTLLACGIPDKPILEEVDANNLDKFGPGSYRREDGKWMKPKDWTPPNIALILEDLGYEGA